jgi:hypothetical protein
MDSIRVSEAPDSGSIPDEATKEETRRNKKKQEERIKYSRLF